MENKKSVGITTSEEYVGKLGSRSFLSLWCYLNLYKEQGKELCDMLVVSNNDVIIFSVKEIKYNRDKDDETAWQRWYRKAIDVSAKQIFGAEKWLLNSPSQVFWDASCKENCLLNLPSDIKIHRVCVPWGISNECAEYYQNGDTGSLMLSSELDGIEQHKKPFVVGQPNCAEGFVHIFDDFVMDTIFQEIDTTPDFINYLNKREAFLSQDNFKFLTTGEEELLALYLTKMNENNEHDFVLPTSRDENLGFWDQGGWKAFIKDKQYIKKKAADKDSYIWDYFIERFAGDSHIYGDNGFRKGKDSEIKEALRHMAEEPRLRRRQLAEALIGLLAKTPKNEKRIGMSYSEVFKKIYIFTISSQTDEPNYDDYRESRQVHLLNCCKVAKLLCPAAKYIIGLAVESISSETSTEDLLVLNVENWTDENQKEAQEIQNKHSIFKNPTFHEGKTSEYPE